mmetsp:Transcript_3992/g.4414  ORF Transcript_3992/g.4414 Transcript_3992/m.4414 type:complete len:223 (-) Transcript_3992:750-1418(-)
MATPAVATYTRSEKYLAMKDQILREAEEIFAEAKWKIKKTKDGFTTRKSDNEFLGQRLRGCVGKVDLDLDILIKLVFDPWAMEAAANVDEETILETKLLESVDEDCCIIYQLMKAPFPMSNRSATWIVAKKDLGGGKILINSQTLEHSATPKNDKVIASEMLSDAFLLDTDQDGLQVQYAGFYNPKGSIPGFVKDMIGTELYERLPILEKTYQKLLKKGIRI